MIALPVNKMIIMKKIIFPIAFALCVAMAACGGGDTGEGYNSNDTQDFNTDPNVTFTDSAVSPAAGDRGNPDSSLNVTPQGTGADTGRTNVNRSGTR
jgi:hypothetical protein